MRGNNGRVSVNDDDVSTNDGKMSLGKWLGLIGDGCEVSENNEISEEMGNG